MAWGTAIAIAAPGAACTLLFPFTDESDDPARVTDGDGSSDAGTPAVDTCGQVISQFDLPGPAIGVAFEHDDLVATWQGGGMDCIDMSDPASPTVLASRQLDSPAVGLGLAPCPACDIEPDGRVASHLYVSDALGLEVVHAAPDLQVVARLDLPSDALAAAASANGARAMVSFDNRIAVVDIHGVRPGAEVLSLEDRDTIVETPCPARHVAPTTTPWIAALLEGPGCDAPSLLVTRLGQTDPYTPLTYALEEPAHDVAVLGSDDLLVAAGQQGLRFVALGRPPLALERISLVDEAHELTLHGDHAIVATAGRAQVVDVGDPEDPVLRGDVDIPGEPLDIATNGRELFVALGDDGVAVIDVRCLLVRAAPYDDGRDDGGEGEGEGEGEPPPDGPTSCDPAQIAIESADGRVQCAAECRAEVLGNHVWCTTECARDEDCKVGGQICDPSGGYCAQECSSDQACIELGLNRCDDVRRTCQ